MRTAAGVGTLLVISAAYRLHKISASYEPGSALRRRRSARVPPRAP